MWQESKSLEAFADTLQESFSRRHNRGWQVIISQDATLQLRYVRPMLYQHSMLNVSQQL